MTRIVKPKTDRERAAAEFVLKGALTRLALMFQMSGRSFTGREVAAIIIAAQVGHEHPELIKEIDDVPKLMVGEVIP